jgi:hypothetical protein
MAELEARRRRDEGQEVPTSGGHDDGTLLAELPSGERVLIRCRLRTGTALPDAVFGRVVTEPGGRRLAFDVAVPGPPQSIAPEADPGPFELPELD